MRKYVLAIVCLFLGGVHIAFAQDRQISGTVTSAEEGSTYPGVTVMVPGTTIGAITDLDGNYRITIPDNATELQFKYVGNLILPIPEQEMEANKKLVQNPYYTGG